VRHNYSWSAAAAALVLLAATARADMSAAPVSRTIYFSVVDNKGAPVPGLTSADVTVKENNKEYPVEKFGPATGPLQIAVIVDDNGTGAFRSATAGFIQNMLGKAEFEIVTVLQQVRRLTEFTTDVNTLKAAIDSLGQRSGVSDGSFLTDAIFEAGEDLQKRAAARPAIVVITAAGPDRSNAQSGDVLKQLKATMASLNVVSLSSPMVTASGTSGLGALINDAEGNRALDEGPRQSGGKRHGAQTAQAVTAALKLVSDQLSSQYALTYTLPDGVKPHERLQIQVKKGGTTVLAPTRIDDR
jgi:VWFA-related protein